ncbi:hypothetical protein ABPG77_002563 [Micractinium sp. CCAP 211/92]
MRAQMAEGQIHCQAHAPVTAPLPLEPAAVPPAPPAAGPAAGLLLPHCRMTPFAVPLTALLAMVLTPSLRAASMASALCPAAFMLCTLACAASGPYLQRRQKAVTQKQLVDRGSREPQRGHSSFCSPGCKPQPRQLPPSASPVAQARPSLGPQRTCVPIVP